LSQNEPDEPQPSTSFSADDHTYSLDSPSKFKRKWLQSEERLESTSKRLHAAEKRESRLEGTVAKLVDEMKTLKTINDETCQLLNVFSDLPLHMFQKSDGNYSDEVKRFATTLKFYSSKAYDFVKDELHLPLPSKRTICRWLSHVSGKPGFTKEAWLLMEKRLEGSDAYRYRTCLLMLDEMSIRKHTSWNVHEGLPEGFVDVGAGCIDGDMAPVAKNVLVFMLVGIYGAWKLPVGYFLVSELTSDLQQNLLQTCFEKIHEHNIECVAVVCDGSYVNQSTFSHFGAKFIGTDICPYFTNPAVPGKRVYLIFDVCHMIKLLRNALAMYKSFELPGKGTISWDYVEKLQNVQKADGLRAANKLTDDHLHFEQAKMKVRLAVQVFSQSVATSLDFMRSIGQTGFENSEATADFIRLCDRLFDSLNSRTSRARGSKSALNLGNFEYVSDFLMSAKATLLSLHCPDGQPLHRSKRRLCVVGLCASIDSILTVSYDLLQTGFCKYVLTYRFSQDHLELFFNAVRQSLGQNNNPTASQFKSAYRALLTRAGVKPTSAGNVDPQVPTELLQVSPIESCQLHDSSGTAAELVEFNSMSDFIADESFMQDVLSLSQYTTNVLCYIAGFVVRKMLHTVQCDECRYSLVCHSSERQCASDELCLLRLKTHGGLIIASDDVCRVIKVCEATLRSSVDTQALTHCLRSVTQLELQCMMALASITVFDSLKDHALDTRAADNVDDHVYHLKRLIIKHFMCLRRCHAFREFSRKAAGKSVRKKLSKTVLFKHQ